MDKKELAELLSAASRMLEEDGAQKVFKYLDAVFGLNANVFAVLKFEGVHADKAVYAREGARAYSDALKGLVENIKNQMETEENE